MLGAVDVELWIVKLWMVTLWIVKWMEVPELWRKLHEWNWVRWVWLPWMPVLEVIMPWIGVSGFVANCSEAIAGITDVEIGMTSRMSVWASWLLGLREDIGVDDIWDCWDCWFAVLEIWLTIDVKLINVVARSFVN